MVKHDSRADTLSPTHTAGFKVGKPLGNVTSNNNLTGIE
jgi:hypothetical protein